jgi:hypothetical protein
LTARPAEEPLDRFVHRQLGAQLDRRPLADHRVDAP